ncbi:hypothetical protein EJ05DRAFT_457957 [Pseudovirgaria hyperparasitica]|uniref:RWD domain-containing protein n=1 Tax=Pseudovirgaria hyperparasitica TaxID=470096 RepID=A0A6A6VU56_9PEZI|nr:uncharacterized protein EJ05DRAFT_457957 [Pseudovirgaria hyperparasitica]KAF2753429.1 hypothetical protein EJ05DRAFT_457957 [Pseudovirgaria hyperparasitica]
MAGDRRSSSGSTLSSPFDSPTFERDVSISVPEDVGAASISPSGRDVVLASKGGLYIIDLDSPYQPPRYIVNRSHWEVADVQWSPFASRDTWIVSTSNQKAIVWNLALSGPNIPIEHVLRAHNGAITDINFSAHHQDLLATCGVDSFVICWDLRQRQNAVLSFDGKGSSIGAVAKFAAWDSGATQVKWNRQDPNIVASSHGQYLHIWDRRKGAEPLKKICAHATKVYGIDWNRASPTGILTCGLDKTIKVWDYSLCGPGDNPEAERIIHTPYPVWRARHTPFGSGFLAMPQRGSTELHMYDLRTESMQPNSTKIEPVHSFSGHEDNIKEFLWRTRGEFDEVERIDNREFQLVSWGRDRNLQLHKMEPEILKSIGYEKGRKTDDNIRQTRKNAAYRTFATESIRRPILQRSESEDATVQPKSHLTALFHPKSANANEQYSSYMNAQVLPSVSFPLPGGGSGMQMMNRTLRAPNVINWMKGVRMGKRDTALPSKYGNRPKTPQSAGSKFDPTENLGDEITHVGSKFKKVSFEVADISRRAATVYLNGPWGPEGKPAFVRITMRFPPNYPRDAAPDYKLEKTTSAISDETIAKLDDEIHSIVELYRTRKKGSLEAIISYLLGERDLEESISYFSEDNDTQTGLTLDESSSDEEEPLGDDFKTRGDLDMSGTDVSGMKNANANVPIPRTNSARWTRDGRLLHIHPPKPEPKPIFGSMLRHGDRSKAPRLFDTLGRLKTGSPMLDKKYSLQDEDVEEDDSDWETASSSSSDYSSTNLGGIAGQFPAPAAWQGNGLRFNKTSQHSSVDYGPKTSTLKQSSVITSHDLSDLLPSRKELAREYEMCGDGPSVCKHNAEVAKSHGFHDLADIWTLISLILANNVPLEVLPQFYRPEPILVVARRAMVRIKRKDSGLDLAFDEAESVLNPTLKGRVKWGHHPLASSWLIPALFDYYERLADIQMLAMLSCVFSEPAAREGVPHALRKPEFHELPMSMQAPAFSLDYFSSHDSAWSLYQPSGPSTPSTPTTQSRRKSSKSVAQWIDKFHKPPNLDVYGSTASSNGPWGSTPLSDPLIPFSTNVTPPVLSRTSTFKSSGNASFSTSPEHPFPRRSNAYLASAFVSPFRNLTSASPPPGKSRTADAELSTSAPNSVTWGSTTFYSSSSNTTQRSSQKRRPYFPYLHESGTVDEVDELSGDEDEVAPSESGDSPSTAAANSSSAIRVTLKNQDQFDDEACVSSSLLGRVETWKLVHYREQYANQLLLWGLPVARSEVLKFNGLHSYWEPEEPTSLQFEVGKKHTMAPRVNGINGLRSSRSDGRLTPLQGTGTFSPKKFRFNPEASAFVPTSSSEDMLSDEELESVQYSGLASNLTVTLTPAVTVTATRTTATTTTTNTATTTEDGHDVDTDTVVFKDTEGDEASFPYCNTCLMKVERLYSICETCGHIAHIACLADYDEEDEAAMCKMGCGCECEESWPEDP